MIPERSFTHLSLLLVEYCSWKPGKALKQGAWDGRGPHFERGKTTAVKNLGGKGGEGQIKIGI